MSKILIIEDEAAIRRVLTKILSEESTTYIVEDAEDGMQGLEKIKNNDYDLVLCDIKMPKMDGVEVLEAVKKIKPEIPMVMISGHGDMETAVQTMRLGAFDYISKPPDLNRLLNTVRNALDKKQLVVENKILKNKVSKNYDMIGESEAINRIKLMIDKVAQTEARVLITGPNGTGKELVAHQLHEKSQRANFSLIEVNCAAIPSELIESELFGHVKGAFTSAVKDRAGKFEVADKGTIFLDEIGDMSLSAQAKVLRALQENVITRVGADCIVIAPKGSGKSTTIVLNVIQQLKQEGEESPRALIIVEDKTKVIEMEALFEKYGKYTDLRVYGVHDKGDMEYDKNYISTGIDVLIGTPNKLGEMFTTAGYNVNRLRMFILDDADPILKLRHETKIMRISNSITKTQRIIFSEVFSERIEILADKMLLEPFEFDFEEEEDFEEEDFEEEE